MSFSFFITSCTLGFSFCSFYGAGLDALLVVSLNTASHEDFSYFEFGKGFDYRTHLTIGMKDVGTMLARYLVSCSTKNSCSSQGHLDMGRSYSTCLACRGFQHDLIPHFPLDMALVVLKTSKQFDPYNQSIRVSLDPQAH